MSHYTVVVIGVEQQKLADAMEPFSESTKNPAFLEFDDIEDEYRTRYETQSAEKIRLKDGTLKWPWDDSFRKSPLAERVYPEGSESVMLTYREMYADFETFMEKFAGHDSRDAGKGRYGLWTNPKGVWDWYAVGGRWSGFFKNKAGTPHRFVSNKYEESPEKGWSDLVRVEDWDLAGQMDDAAERRARHYQRVYEVLDGRPLPPRWLEVVKTHNEDYAAAREAYHAHPTNVFVASLHADPKMREDLVFDPFEDIAEEYGCTLQEYIELARLRTASPYAILKNGEWMSRGNMGMFGMSSGDIPERDWCRMVHGIYAELAPDTELIAVDCHT